MTGILSLQVDPEDFENGRFMIGLTSQIISLPTASFAHAYQWIRIEKQTNRSKICGASAAKWMLPMEYKLMHRTRCDLSHPISARRFVETVSSVTAERFARLEVARELYWVLQGGESITIQTCRALLRKVWKKSNLKQVFKRWVEFYCAVI